jgi:hypothetical protein
MSLAEITELANTSLWPVPLGLATTSKDPSQGIADAVEVAGRRVAGASRGLLKASPLTPGEDGRLTVDAAVVTLPVARAATNGSTRIVKSADFLSTAITPLLPDRFGITWRHVRSYGNPALRHRAGGILGHFGKLCFGSA